MERERYIEMMENLKRLSDKGVVGNSESVGMSAAPVFLFAHCEATMELADELIKLGVKPAGILDNNPNKYGLAYKGIPVCEPKTAVRDADDDRAEVTGGKAGKDTIILIVSRFYEQMASQMRGLGFTGRIEKLTDYNTYAEYSLSPDTLISKSERLKRGLDRLREIKASYPGYFIVLCPFPALGDIYFCMSYLKPYLETIGCNKNYDEYCGKSDRMDKYKCLVCVVGNAQRQVAELFDYAEVLKLDQKEMDEAIQAIIYTDDSDCYIAHQDRPYVVDLHRALYKKCIPLEIIYKCGIFGLPKDTCPTLPIRWENFKYLHGCLGDVTESNSEKNYMDWNTGTNAAIISPYAKSVASLPETLWTDIVDDLTKQGYELFTNVVGDEKPLPNTQPISPTIAEMKSAVEQAGLFVGIRSGMCDVIKTADCRKIALYPDYYYSDTKWKSIDMYSIDEFENIVVKDGDTWDEVKKQIRL
ncbi:MAG: hypothetical protein J6I76_18170 [Oribacterium sp.]|nr:hypothetical protein [Oribacterium sp.]